METNSNTLIIEIPEGMEIDTENSSLAEGIVKFKKHDITYNDILQACPTNFGGLRVRIHCMDKILAISQLMNIAKYYNGDWKPNWCNTDEYKYYIIYKSNDNTYVIDYSLNYIHNSIYFRNKKDAIDIINNPNFKTILDAIYKN
jgi:hypothetical protein